MSFLVDLRRRRIRDLAPRLLLGISLVFGVWYGLGNVAGAIQFVLYASAGIFLILRRPGNVIGWILLGLGWCFVLVGVPSALDIAALQAKRAPPWQELMAWIGTWIGPALMGLFFVLTVVFPNGRVPGGAWGRVARLALVVDAGLVVLASVQPTAFTVVRAEGTITVPNPLALFPEAPFWEIARGGQLILPVIGLLFAGVGSILIRYRRASGPERQQLRWLVSALGFVVASIVVGMATFALVGDASWIPAQVAFLMVPVSIGVAVTRYRLYEIDRIVSRTLAYALLTAILAGVYLAGFLGLQAILAPLIANGGSIAVAASTLAVFALFQPVRRRIQGVVDRRFHRSRYDAAREIDGFAARVRDEVEVDRLEAVLATTLERTMQPTSASIWLRGR